MENVKNFLLGKTIDKVEFTSWRAPNDTLRLGFTDGSHLKIMSDPNCCFDGLAFYIMKSKTIEIEEEVEVK
jgi:hypothetical protein